MTTYQMPDTTAYKVTYLTQGLLVTACGLVNTVTVESMRLAAKAIGQLVVLGFDVAVFTPAPYQRGSLPRPSKEPSSCGRLRT